MFDDGPRGRRVALGGASRGASGRSKQALLEESRRKRGERERAVAPSRAALVLGRHARGSICRAAVATRLCDALEVATLVARDVAQQSSTALEPAAALSLVRRLTWLNRIRPSLADAALVEAVARTLLEGQRCGEPFLAARCVCDGGGRWERTAPPLVPPLLRAAASQHASVQLLRLLLDPPAAALPPCCATRAASEARRLLDRCAPDCMSGFGKALAESSGRGGGGGGGT